jgi:hypothetical protein
LMAFLVALNFAQSSGLPDVNCTIPKINFWKIIGIEKCTIWLENSQHHCSIQKRRSMLCWYLAWIVIRFKTQSKYFETTKTEIITSK